MKLSLSNNCGVAPSIIVIELFVPTMLCALVFLSPSSVVSLSSQQITETPPLPLSSSIMYEQYDQGSLYKTHFEAPYNEHPFQPRKIHLSPSSDIDPKSGLYNATVSFTLDLSAVTTSTKMSNSDAAAMLGSVGRNMIRTRVTYGTGDDTEGSVVIHYDEGDYRENNGKRITEEFTLLRFNYTSLTTGKYYQSDIIHHVLLKDLVAGRQRYWYNISVEFSRFFLRGSYSKTQRRDSELFQKQRNDHKPTELVLLGETPTYEFTTPPLYGSPTSIALVGDLGQTKNSTRTMARILDSARAATTGKNSRDLEEEDDDDCKVTNLFIAGDLSYADGDPERWDSWLDLAEPLLRELPFASIPGNHEVECDKTTHDVFVPYESFFRNPNRIGEAVEVPPSQDYIDTMWHHLCTTPSEFIGQYDYGNAYFSYKHGLVHTIFLNSYASLLDGSKQREWLLNTALPEVDRDRTPWLVVIFHTPMYTTFSNHYGELNPTLMKASGLLQVFERYKINLVVSGHDHAYMRTKSLDAQGTIAENKHAPVFWTLGAGGNREGHSRYRDPNKPEDWVAKRDNDEYGFGLFFAPNRTHAHLQWMRDDDNNYQDDSSSASVLGNNINHNNSSLVVRDSVWIENYYYQY